MGQNKSAKYLQEKNIPCDPNCKILFGSYLGTVFEHDISHFQISSSLCKIYHMHQTQQYAVTMVYLEINIAGTIADW